MRLNSFWVNKFSAFVRKHRPALLRRAYRVCRSNTTDAEDLVQEALERALETCPNMKNYDDDVVLAYLFTTLARLLIDQARRRRFEVIRGPSPVEPEVALSDDQLERWRAISDEALQQAEQSLRPKVRQAYLLRRSGKSYEQIAKEMNTTTGTVGSWISEARLELRKRLLADGDSDLD